MKRLLVFLLSITLFLAFTSSAALAVPVTSLFYGDGSTNVAEDDDVEWLEQDGNTAGILDVGDTLRGVYRIQDFNNSNIGAEGQTSTGLSGVFEAEVTSKTATGSIDRFGNDLYNFEFAPASYDTGLFQNSNSIIAVYETDPLPNFDDDAGSIRSKAELISDATDGTLLYEFGFTDGANSEYWFSDNITDDPSQGEDIDSSQQLGGFNTALNVTYNNFLPVLSTQFAPYFNDFGGSGFSDLIGSGNILGTGGSVDPMGTTAQLSSDVEFKFATVPEPTTLLLFGTGLLGLAAFGRKKFMGKNQ